MIWILNNWRLIAAGGALIGSFIFGWTEGSSHIHAAWDDEKRATQEEAMRVMQVHAEMIKTLEIQHDQNTDRIDALAADNHALRLRLRPTSCGGSASPGGSVQTPAGNGPLHSDASEIIAGYTEEVGRQFVIADKIVEDCRVMRQDILTRGKASVK